MRKLLVALAAAALAVAFMVAMSGTAAAQGPGERGKACPEPSPGHPDSPTPGCGHEREDEEPPPPPPPNGDADAVCDDERVALVLLRDLSEDAPVLICLYDEGISQEELDADCPDALLALTGGADGPGAICVLPAEPEEAALALRGVL